LCREHRGGLNQLLLEVEASDDERFVLTRARWKFCHEGERVLEDFKRAREQRASRLRRRERVRGEQTDRLM
jgi:hypothetical protein